MDTIETIKEMQKDIRNLKLKAFQPDKSTARVFKEYFTWSNGNSKENFAALYAKELELLNDWFEVYCKEYNCTKEDALERIIE